MQRNSLRALLVIWVLVFCGTIAFAHENRFTGTPAHLVEKSLSKKLQKEWLAQDYAFVPSTRHCSAYLPLFANHAAILGGLLQMRHTWVEIDEKSYGMAYTLKHHYFGGKSRMQSPDAFQKYRLKDVQCTPLLAPAKDPRFHERARCILDRVANEKNYLVLEYHVFRNNCLAAIDWAVECAGGKLSRLPNLGIGNEFSPDFLSQFSIEPKAYRRHLGAICQELRAACD